MTKLINPALIFTAFLLSLSLPALACEAGDPNQTDYMRRENNRCEGIYPTTNVSSSLRLISLVARNLPDGYGDRLSLRIPHNGTVSPVLRIQSLRSRYILDNPQLTSNASGFTLNWSTFVLQEAEVPVNSLRAIAFLNESQPIYIPVLLGPPASEYEIVFYSPNRTTFKQLEIVRVRDNQVVYTHPQTPPQTGEIRFTWNAQNVPAGDYFLRVVAEIEQFSRPPETRSSQIVFRHDPNWLQPSR